MIKLIFFEKEQQNAQTMKRRQEQLDSMRGPLKLIAKLWLQGYNMALDYASFLLPASIFFYMFLEW